MSPSLRATCLLAGIATGVDSLDAGLVVFVAWLTCATSAVGVHSTLTMETWDPTYSAAIAWWDVTLEGPDGSWTGHSYGVWARTTFGLIQPGSPPPGFMIAPVAAQSPSPASEQPAGPRACVAVRSMATLRWSAMT